MIDNSGKALIIPMTVLAANCKTAVQVPALNPHYTTALSSYLGKDSSPPPFNANIVLHKGVHLHFILPSAFKKGKESTDSDASAGAGFEYPAVPDRFIVTRMYAAAGKIETACFIVESSFISLDPAYSKSVSIPQFDDLRPRHRYRYLGRSYSASSPAPPVAGESGYVKKLTALGPGDPLFAAYYPSCMSVFGFYDDLAGVPQNAVLTYSVIGYYADSVNDPFHEVKTPGDMAALLSEYAFTTDDPSAVCGSCLLAGGVAGIDLAKDAPPPTGDIHVGIGETSAEALSAVVTGLYYPNQPEAERLITAIQYDAADEAAQIDGNFKIDDDIHSRGFSHTAALEDTLFVRLPKDIKKNAFAGFEKKYAELSDLLQQTGKLMRKLTFKKESLYWLWEMFMARDEGSRESERIQKYMDALMGEITTLRTTAAGTLTRANAARKTFAAALEQHGAELASDAASPFYLPGDPVLMLFGSGMKRTYAFGEDGRFEEDGSVYCLTKPLSSNIATAVVLSYFKDIRFTRNLFDGFTELLAQTVLLDTMNILHTLCLSPVINEKYSPLLLNNAPGEQVTLLMQWRTEFCPNYRDANPVNSALVHGETDYRFSGYRQNDVVFCEGTSVLTPHGVYNLQNKLKKYLENHADDPAAAKIADKIKDLPAVSQCLSGFNESLIALRQVFQFPITIDPQDVYSRRVMDCLSPSRPLFPETPPERLAVRDNTAIFPLRDGYFTISKLGLVSSFGIVRPLIDDDLTFKGKRYFSEKLRPNGAIPDDGYCLFPLALTTPARLSAAFVSAAASGAASSPLPGASPVIAIFMPDMLNRNLDVYSSAGAYIGTLKTVYRTAGGKKTAAGRFIPSPTGAPIEDERIRAFIAPLNKDTSALAELMAVIDRKLNATLPLAQNDFIFGRALVLAEARLEIELLGGAHFSMKDQDLGAFKDEGLTEQKFSVRFGDVDRVADGVCCGFYGGFERGFTAFGAENSGNAYLNAPPFSLSAAGGAKNVALLFDPALAVTVTSGFLPVISLSLCAEHADFSAYSLQSAEMNVLVSDANQAHLPDFTHGADFSRFYPRLDGGKTIYNRINIAVTGNFDADQETIITDGVITKIPKKNEVPV